MMVNYPMGIMNKIELLLKTLEKLLEVLILDKDLKARTVIATAKNL